MLFSGEEAEKKAKVLSGGEKVRCMLAKMMLESGNFLLLDEPTNHLDLESITALNKGMERFEGCMIFSTHDEEIISTVANRIMRINSTLEYDKEIDYDTYDPKHDLFVTGGAGTLYPPPTFFHPKFLISM